jgi:hypothetical protein
LAKVKARLAATAGSAAQLRDFDQWLDEQIRQHPRLHASTVRGPPTSNIPPPIAIHLSLRASLSYGAANQPAR